MLHVLILQVLLRNICFINKITFKITFAFLEFADALITTQPSSGVGVTGICPRDKQTSSKHWFDSFLELVYYVCWMQTGDL